ncbi:MULTISPECIES: D-arabinono-1,4-lactone oxidase [Thermomonospora]|uniref:FAD-linked oxidoreductase n=1 Tax=Thermomonospora curvata (strain ATCC 19995 / DSM 43183 / JCM 3096 / KCTC 9072 / NBRC 15933 / NCIMB 10081 / Henssen B9) TaxID=471852 RepID=D1ABZ7_THECD|nr:MULTISPECIES: D-arabinono-1,4-lactone oxidase [Thermomonospora]ACY97263.1 FAD-linked oxidoreductase [Thermomonospora curvata DSM 43183]PKK14634.1 MAG: FAD-linked oxidoreductase [Thermomonospora sp. CIF 1]
MSPARTFGTQDHIWRNWAGNQRAVPARTLAPRSTEEVAEAVRTAAAEGLTVRMTGTGHSFTAAAVTDGLLLRPDRLRAVRSVDTATGLVTVEAGLPLHELNRVLDEHGLALANMGDIQQQTVAGALQTGTHGTGRDHAGLASQVAALELVLADGSIVTCSRTERPELFDAARVSLGALGVVTAITWQTVPAFRLHAREEPMRWGEVLERLDELTEANEHFEFYWFPHTEGCLTKRNNRTDRPAAPLSPLRYWLDDELLSNTVFGGLQRLTRRVPAAIGPVNAVSAKALGARTYIDTSYKVFTSPRRVRFKEQEYAIPREHLADTLRELKALFDRRDWRISFPIEVRVLPPEDAWLSMAYDRPSAFIAVHVYHRNPHEDYFAGVEELMTAVGGRPHWGKLHTRDAAYLEQVYPKFADFRALREELDPDRRFANRYLSRVFGP